MYAFGNEWEGCVYHELIKVLYFSLLGGLF